MEKIESQHVEHVRRPLSPDSQPLSRQMTTVALTPEQYERLFFQPSAPRGDLSKRLGNPTLLGLIGFLVPYTSTVLSLLQFRGAVPPYSLVGLTGDYYFMGAIAMNIAGICEFVLGNTFPFAVFCIYGCHWGALAYAQDPSHNLVGGLVQTLGEAEGGPASAIWNSSQGFHNVTMCLVSFVLFLATFRVNALFVLVFLGLVFLFAFVAAADFALAQASVAGVEPNLAHVLYLLKLAGGFGMISCVIGFYLAIIVGCESTGIPCPLPVFDLSSKVFPKNKDDAQKN